METVQVYAIRTFTTREGKNPFFDWFDSLRHGNFKARILNRLARVRQGDLGDYRDLKGGIHELRLFFGSGYRIYFARKGDTIILLIGGTKGSQKRDIERARSYYRDYLEREDG